MPPPRPHGPRACRWTASDGEGHMTDSTAMQTLLITQRRDWVEAFTGFEAANHYTVMDPDGQVVFHAAEESGFLGRNFLKALRPFTMHVLSPDGGERLRIRRPFRLLLHELEVRDADGGLIGFIRRRFTLLRRLYSVEDDNGQERFELFGPILHPWTLRIRREGEQIGRITKRWSGFAAEVFTSADNFAVEWPTDLPETDKALLLSAAFLIDYVHFERKGND